jgi:3-oxoacyl-[acyl-carrier protein] reductase
VDYGIRGQVAVVTGGGRGLGESMCRALAAEGCRLAVWDVDAKAAREVAASIRAAGGEAIAVSGDVSRRAPVTRTIAAIIRKFGRIDILVNNAGFSRDAAITEMTDQDWKSVIDV